MENITLTAKVLIYKFEECNIQQKKLIDKAKDICKKAYAPYSNFNVGAAILLEDGSIITGNNQENAAYPSGTCAERTALFYTNAHYPEQKIEAIAIVAYHKDQFTDDICTPCGACRQAILEMENKYQYPIKILMCSKEKVYEVSSIKDLLPLSFGSDALKSFT